MSFQQLLETRLETKGPIGVGLIGAGKFGSMFLAQVPSSPGISVNAIADLKPDTARKNCEAVGWPDELIAKCDFIEDGVALAARDDIDVIIDATGAPIAGIAHARAASANGKHIVMVNVEADVLAGPLLAREAAQAGTVYSMAYGDQPALVAELIDWARGCGFPVVAAGKGTQYLPSFHASTPETVWPHYGMDPEAAAAAGLNPQMFNSFIDGTKSAIEMAAIANGSGLRPPSNGLSFPPCSVGDLSTVLRPHNEGGILEHKGQVEVVSCLNRDGTEVPNHLRWGVYVVFEAPGAYTEACFKQYGVRTDSTGRYSALYRPFHLIGLELNISILSAALRGEATGTARGFVGDVASVAKRPLKAGELLDGEGGFTVWGKLIPAETSLEVGALPIGLAHNVKLMNDIGEGDIVHWSDVAIEETSDAVKTRKEMEAAFKSC